MDYTGVAKPAQVDLSFEWVRWVLGGVVTAIAQGWSGMLVGLNVIYYDREAIKSPAAPLHEHKHFSTVNILHSRNS